MVIPSQVVFALHIRICWCTLAAGDGRVVEANGGRLPLLANDHGPLCGVSRRPLSISPLCTYSRQTTTADLEPRITA